MSNSIIKFCSHVGVETTFGCSKLVLGEALCWTI